MALNYQYEVNKVSVGNVQRKPENHTHVQNPFHNFKTKKINT